MYSSQVTCSWVRYSVQKRTITYSSLITQTTFVSRFIIERKGALMHCHHDATVHSGNSFPRALKANFLALLKHSTGKVRVKI